MAVMDQTRRAAGLGEVFFVVIDVQRVEDRHSQIVWLDVGGDVGAVAVFIGTADEPTRLNASTAHQALVGAWIMVAADVGVDFRRAAEFPHGDDQRSV